MDRFRRLVTFKFTAFALILTKAITTATKVVSSDRQPQSPSIKLLTENNGNIDNNDDDDGHTSYGSSYISHEGNSTLSATFSIRVTPEHYRIISWTFLWTGFAAAVLFGMHQIRLERKWIKLVTSSRNFSHTNGSLSQGSSSAALRSQSYSRLRKYSVVNQGQNPGGERSPQDPELGLGSGGGGMRTTSRGGRIVRTSRSGNNINIGSGYSSRMTLSSSTASLNNSSNPDSLGDEQPVSSGDLARATFRRLILVAMASRTVAIPIQVYSDPLWVQLIADTFPVMTYATAWTWLVSFFVQLVTVALGSTNSIGVGNASTADISASANTTRSPQSPYRPAAPIDTVIQITAYVVYALLIIAFTIFRRIAAAVLLYALLCCVYATLLGTALYFCPRLLALLLSGLDGKWHSPLVLRLVACSGVSLLVFAARTFCFAKKVVQSTKPLGRMSGGPYWWFQYGALELLPGVLFLVLLHPKRTAAPNSANTSSGNNGSTKSSSSGSSSGRINQYPTVSGFGGERGDPHPSGRRTPPFYSSYQRSDSNDSKPGTPSPSPTPPVMSQTNVTISINTIGNIKSNPKQETAPLLNYE